MFLGNIIHAPYFQIPLIKRANEYRDEEIMLIGSPWTAPPWMKSNNDYIGVGYLLPEYYESWANYFVRSVLK